MTAGDRYLVAMVANHVVVLDTARRPATPCCLPLLERTTGDAEADLAAWLALAGRIARGLNVDEQVAASVRDATRGLPG